MANLVELFDNIVQMQNLNGVPLANGKMYVYALGRTRLMDTWSDVDGESLNSNPIILDAAGQCHCYVTDDFDYTIVVCDAYDNEIFSIDKYLYSQGSHSHADVAVAPSETIAVSSYHVGETTVYVPYLTGQLGKVYEGIDPIVVNNTEDKISANHVPLGVQDPLYFVQDDEEGCIIGFSGQTIPEGVMSESALGFENNKITGYNGSAFSAGNEYEAGSYVDITDNTISVTGLPTSADVQNIVDVATSGLMPSGDYLTKESADTLYAPTGNYLTGLPDDLVYSADITGFATTAQLGEKLDKSDSANFYPMEGNPSGFLTAHQSLQGYATEQWVEDKGYLTAVDIPESATWNATTQTVSANSAQWAGGTANPQIPVTGINGIKISESGDKVVFEVSADYYPGNNPSGFITGVDLSDYATTAQLAEKQDSLSYGYHDTAISSIDESAIYDTSAHARINTLAGRISDLSSNKLDTTAFSDVSGTFITAHQDLSDYQTIAGMTAYQSAGDYYSASNPSGFISEVPAGTMNESAFSYDASDNITAYNGSAFKAGDEFPQSATEAIETVTANSADWNGTTETVSSNSGAWGGSALPISAGPGIKFEMVNDTLVASTDETVLFFAGNDSSGVQAGNLTESIKNFERIRVAGMDNGGHVDVKYIYPAWTKNSDNFDATGYEVMLYGAYPDNNTVWQKWTRYSFSALTSFNVVISYEGPYSANSINDVTNSHKNSIREVVGINRIVGGN